MAKRKNLTMANLSPASNGMHYKDGVFIWNSKEKPKFFYKIIVNSLHTYYNKIVFLSNIKLVLNLDYCYTYIKIVIT